MSIKKEVVKTVEFNGTVLEFNRRGEDGVTLTKESRVKAVAFWCMLPRVDREAFQELIGLAYINLYQYATDMGFWTLRNKSNESVRDA